MAESTLIVGGADTPVDTIHLAAITMTGAAAGDTEFPTPVTPRRSNRPKTVADPWAQSVLVAVKLLAQRVQFVQSRSQIDAPAAEAARAGIIGQTTTHWLSRAGDRAANNARIALVQMPVTNRSSRYPSNRSDTSDLAGGADQARKAMNPSHPDAISPRPRRW
ncbi:hypothetical protein MBOT_35590 [Mycobacterium botniense]|uniref:Uncharacterized protein n=1 Tax=Mycobacterium botniense TaxID=84962 RepID=A0A7I9Y2E0_9MYCO|nr:hypothetical protein MBOT_35590 [Mycobacterium botniense]